MRLSDFKGEAALELLADLIEPAGEILSDKAVADAYRGKNKLKAVSIAIKNHKTAVMRIMATLDGVPVEEFKCNVFTLPIKLMEIMNDPELGLLFGSQGQTGDATSSGSASENTEE